jgi:hypothetical protein
MIATGLITLPEPPDGARSRNRGGRGSRNGVTSMFIAKMSTASPRFLALVAILVCGCTYAPANSGRAAQAPAPIQPDRSAAQSIEDTARLVKERLESCGSKSTSLHHPGTSWQETSWKLASATGCVWRFEYADENYGYISPQDPSSDWYDASSCSAEVDLSQLALNSITTKPSQLDVTEIYFVTFNQTPNIHLNCRNKTNIQLKSGKKTISDEGWEHNTHEEPDLEHWAQTGPFCTDQQDAGRIQAALSHAAALCGARP